MTMMDERDRAMVQELTSSIRELTKSIQPDSFHNRQVASLKRQSKVVELIREKRQIYVNSSNPIVTTQVVLDLLDEIGDTLIKS
ncbi:MAG: hypothetical protein AM326_01585 [Candidatus Thorarchaeota archaeon SMTZ-45]|nr:MAG: hypothetical protein AM326_01585 [Candidatus Thorarchaeota archaeon SMTZ-45]